MCRPAQAPLTRRNRAPPSPIHAAGEEAAVHGDDLACDGARRVGGEEDGGAGQLLDLAEATRRRAQQQLTPALLAELWTAAKKQEAPGDEGLAAFQKFMILHEDMPLEVLQDRDPTKAIPPLHGALLKNEQDVMLFERLAFMSRRKV